MKDNKSLSRLPILEAVIGVIDTVRGSGPSWGASEASGRWVSCATFSLWLWVEAGSVDGTAHGCLGPIGQEVVGSFP